MKKGSIIIILLIASLSLTGCWDKTELEDYGYVAVVGIDREHDNNLRITFQIGNPQVGTLIQGQVQEPASLIQSFPGVDIQSARELASASITRRLTLTHAKALIINEDLAAEDNFFQILTGPARDPDIRDEINIIVCREKAEDFIRNNKPLLETRPGKYYTFMATRWKETGSSPLKILINIFV